MGVLCLIKPHYGLFVLWALLRKEWRFAFACVAAGCVGLIGSLAVFGWTNHLDYLPVLSHLAERGETYYPNHSVNGLLNRLMSVVEPELYRNLDWGDGAFPPFNRFVYWTTTISSAAILLLAILRRNRDNDPDRVVDFCTMAVSATVASPIAWEHHYGVLFPVFAVVLVGALRSRARLPWLIVSYVLASNYFIATQLLAPTFWNFIQSYLLFATWILLVLLHLRPPQPLASANASSADAPRNAASGRAAHERDALFGRTRSDVHQVVTPPAASGRDSALGLLQTAAFSTTILRGVCSCRLQRCASGSMFSARSSSPFTWRWRCCRTSRRRRFGTRTRPSIRAHPLSSKASASSRRTVSPATRR